MTRDDIVELARRRRWFARIKAIGAQAFLGLAGLLFALITLLPSDRLSGTATWNAIGVLLLGVGAVLLTLADLADAKQPDRYAGGDLTVGRSDGRLGQFAAGHLMLAAGFASTGFATLQTFDGPGGWLIGSTLAVMVIGCLVQAGWSWLQRLNAAPILTVSGEGLFAPALMRRPVKWDELESVPVAPSVTPYLLALKVRNAADYPQSFWTRPMNRKATHLIQARAADASQADVLMAVADFRPELIEALALPPATGLMSAIAPASTI